MKTICRSDDDASRDRVGPAGTSGGAPIGFSGVTRWPGGSNYTPAARGVEHVCPGCGGGMGAREELCGSCRYVRDERLGMAAS